MIESITVSLVGKIDGRDEFVRVIESWNTFGMPVKRVMDAAESFRDYWYSESDYLRYSFISTPADIKCSSQKVADLLESAEWCVRVTLIGHGFDTIDSMESDPFKFGKSEVASIYGE